MNATRLSCVTMLEIVERMIEHISGDVPNAMKRGEIDLPHARQQSYLFSVRAKLFAHTQGGWPLDRYFIGAMTVRNPVLEGFEEMGRLKAEMLKEGGDWETKPDYSTFAQSMKAAAE